MANIKVLIVDDQDIMRDLMAEVLIDCTVVTAINGEDGDLKHAELGPFDVVVTDLEMPLCNGPDMIKRIRQRMPDQPFLLVSGNPNLLAKAKHELNVRTMAKPFSSIFEIAEAVRQLAQQRKPVRL